MKGRKGGSSYDYTWFDHPSRAFLSDGTVVSKNRKRHWEQAAPTPRLGQGMQSGNFQIFRVAALASVRMTHIILEMVLLLGLL